MQKTLKVFHLSSKALLFYFSVEKGSLIFIKRYIHNISISLMYRNLFLATTFYFQLGILFVFVGYSVKQFFCWLYKKYFKFFNGNIMQKKLFDFIPNHFDTITLEYTHTHASLQFWLGDVCMMWIQIDLFYKKRVLNSHMHYAPLTPHHQFYSLC